MQIRIMTLTLGATLMALSACTAGGSSDSEPAWSAKGVPEQRQRVMLTGFECGDNCYVRYRSAEQPEGESKAALCTIGPCIAWMAEQSTASEFQQRSAIITLGTGKQYDGGGAVMSDDFPAITSIRLDRATP